MNRQITLEEVSKHDDKKSSWIIIHHDVYDVTHFLDEHPGGADSLLEYAGKDGTQAFEDVAHSEDARELMKKYKIGTIPESERKNHRPKCGFVPYQTEIIVLPAKNDCCQPQVGGKPKKTWRTYDGSSSSQRSRDTEISPDASSPGSIASLPSAMKKGPCQHCDLDRKEPRIEDRVKAIVVPTERARPNKEPKCTCCPSSCCPPVTSNTASICNCCPTARSSSEPPNTEQKFICCPSSCCPPTSRNARSGTDDNDPNTKIYIALAVLGVALLIGFAIHNFSD